MRGFNLSCLTTPHAHPNHVYYITVYRQPAVVPVPRPLPAAQMQRRKCNKPLHRSLISQRREMSLRYMIFYGASIHSACHCSTRPLVFQSVYWSTLKFILTCDLFLSDQCIFSSHQPACTGLLGSKII